MHRITYFLFLLALLATSSCKKVCVKCSAVNQNGTLVNQSNEVCEANPNRDNFIARYEKQFELFKVACIETE